MKNLEKVLAVIFALTIIISCGNDENDSPVIIEKETISAKWLVDVISDFESFEFNEGGNYIVVKNTTTKSTNAQIVLFGTYQIIDDNTIVLSDFGTLKISKINANSISFSIQLTGSSDNEIIIHASKQEEMENTTITELLCRTWKMVTINGDDVTGTEYELSVLFSKAGTYFVEFPDPEDENAGGLASWKWKDEKEIEFLYSWETPPVWSDGNVVEIIEVTNNRLKILEIFSEDYEELYDLIPVINSKSASLVIDKEQTVKKMKAGFLKK